MSCIGRIQRMVTIDDDFIRIQRGNTAAYEEVQEKHYSNVILFFLKSYA